MRTLPVILRSNSSSRRLFSQTCPRFLSQQQQPEGDGEKYTDFGFHRVRDGEKPAKVYKVFEDVAASYDKMNDIFSLGIHRIWKDVLMSRLSPTKGTQLLDLAGGTGDVAFRFLNYIENAKCKEGCHVTVCDINAAMLEVGRSRAKSLGCDPKHISWVQGDGEQLQFESESFDAYTVAFGLRNCTHKDKVLNEAYRVLKPGGRFLCLEFTQLENPVLQSLYDRYSFQLMPVLGHLVAGQWDAYQYLVESIRKFPSKDVIKTMVEEAGFRQVTYENLTMGIVAIHSGFKL